MLKGHNINLIWAGASFIVLGIFTLAGTTNASSGLLLIGAGGSLLGVASDWRNKRDK